MPVVRRSNRTLKQKLYGALTPSLAIATTLYARRLWSRCARTERASPDATADAQPATDQPARPATSSSSPARARSAWSSPTARRRSRLVSGEILQETGATDLMNSLAAQTPSFNASQTGGDMASQTLTAQMRALSPNHALVLVNGHRRHITSNVGAASARHGGGLLPHPSSMIERVEVLTDGAAALYGSDAITGVFNVILKKESEGAALSGGISAYDDGGGDATNYMGNIAFGEDNYFFDIGFEVEDRDTINRPTSYGPAGAFPTGLPARTTSTAATSNTRAPGVRNTAFRLRAVARPATTFRNKAPMSPTTGYLSNNDVNMVFNSEFPNLNHAGDPPELHRKIAMFNFGWDINENLELYSYGSFGEKQANSDENYRRRLRRMAASTSTATATAPTRSTA